MSYDQTPKVAFDVNETLLDIDALEPLFIRLFAHKRGLREWFAQLVFYSQTVTLAGLYVAFSQIGVGVLRMLGEIHHVAIGDSDVEELKSRMRDLPAHPEVPVTLQRLREADFRLVTLTNSAPDSTEALFSSVDTDYFLFARQSGGFGQSTCTRWRQAVSTDMSNATAGSRRPR